MMKKMYVATTRCAAAVVSAVVVGAPTKEHLSLIHISEPTRQEAISYAVFCLKKKTPSRTNQQYSAVAAAAAAAAAAAVEAEGAEDAENTSKIY